MAEFIEERISTDGKHITYRVVIPYYIGQERKFFKQSFNSKKYGSKKLALDQAKEFRDKARLRLNIEGFVDIQTFTLDDVFALKSELFPRSKETERKDRIYYNKYLMRLGNKPIDKISAADIQLTLNEMIETCADDTIEKVYQLWKKIYKTAILKDAVTIDQTIKVTKPKGEKIVKKREMSVGEADFNQVYEKLINGNHDEQLIGYAIKIMYHTGMRPNEVFALDTRNIDRTNKTITVCQSIGSTKNEKTTIRKTKNINSIRTIPYAEVLEPIFDMFDGFMFVRSNGKYFNGNYVAYKLNRIKKGFRAYTIRHQFATDLLSKGVDMRTIQDLMGHKDSSTTLGYARTDENKMREAVKKR